MADSLSDGHDREKIFQVLLLDCRIAMRPLEFRDRRHSQNETDPFGNPRQAPMRVVGPLFLPWVQEAIRDEEVAVIFLKEFWPRIVGEELAKSTVPLRLRKRTLEIGVSGREWEQVLRGMTQPLMTKVNEFWDRSLVRRLDFQVVQPWMGDDSG